MDSSIEFLKSHNSSIMPLPEEEEVEILTSKVILIGDSSVGKTSILYRFMQDEFFENPNVTLGFELSIKKIRLENNESIILNIWDSAGQEKYRSLTYHFYRGVNGIILVFDLKNENTFKNLNSWMAQINKHAPENIDIILVGNKSDDDNNESGWKNNEDLINMMQKHRLNYFETSAKTGKNISKVFYYIAKQIKNRNKIEHIIKKEGPKSPKSPRIKKYDKKKEDAIILRMKNGKNKVSNDCFCNL